MPARDKCTRSVFLKASETGSLSQADKVGCPFSQGCQHGFQHVLTKTLRNVHQMPEEKADLYHRTRETASGTTSSVSS